MRRHAGRVRRVQADVLRPLAAICVLGLAWLPGVAQARRAIPDTNATIAVWDDQLPDSMTEAQIRFVARHVDGTQKVSLQTARRLRAINPGFLVLHYRLGIGDGPVPFRIGRRWASDYGYVTRHESWFWHADGRRVRNTQSDWYLMNPDSGWGSYWARRVLYEARLLGDDGVFADSLVCPPVPGARQLHPVIPLLRRGGGVDSSGSIASCAMRSAGLHGRLWFIPNAGSWITTRDRTDYAIPDGVMIEGFAEGQPPAYYAPGDWALEMNRVLGLVRRGKIILAQSYLEAGDLTARMFVLGSYLLVKGSHTFVNMWIGSEPQWFPEYGLDLGRPLATAPNTIGRLAIGQGLFERRYQHGVVVVNPSSEARTLAIRAPVEVVRPVGGGALDPSASTQGWGLRWERTAAVHIPAHGAVVYRGD